MAREFYIVSVVHTERRHSYVTFWRPKNSGYCWPLSWAGRYDEATVRGALSYYNDGENNIAVDAATVDNLAQKPATGKIDGDAGPVVANNAATWRVLLQSMIEPPVSEVSPQYRGSRRAA